MFGNFPMTQEQSPDSPDHSVRPATRRATTCTTSGSRGALGAFLAGQLGPAVRARCRRTAHPTPQFFPVRPRRDVRKELSRQGAPLGAPAIEHVRGRHAGGGEQRRRSGSNGSDGVVFVEIPAGSAQQVRVGRRARRAGSRRRLFTSIARRYPADYGFVEGTLARTIRSMPSCSSASPRSQDAASGSGPSASSMADEKGPDEKVLCVPLSDVLPGRDRRRPRRVPAQLRNEIEHFFQVYEISRTRRHRPGGTLNRSRRRRSSRRRLSGTQAVGLASIEGTVRRRSRRCP